MLPNPPMKQMFGANGWLDRGPLFGPVAGQKKAPAWKSFGRKLLQKANETTRMVGEAMHLKRDVPGASADSGPSTFPITMEQGDQMRLFGEIDLLLTTVANSYLMDQKEANLLTVASVDTVRKRWAARGRAQVVEFRYDLPTQLELVRANMDRLHFFGTDAESWMRRAAMLNGWKDVARELGVRSFCSADSAVRKLLSDSYLLLEMLGATAAQFLLLQKLHVAALKKFEEVTEANANVGVTRPYVV